MRQSYKNEIMVIDSKLVGISLGADYCAEHEWGIQGIHTAFGIDPSKIGLNKRLVSKTSSNLLWLSKAKVSRTPKDKRVWAGIFFGQTWKDEEPSINASCYGKEDLLTLWSEKDFCILSCNAEKVAQLKQVYEAFEKKDIAIWLGGGGVFENAGLAVAIASNLPKEVTDTWHKADVEHNQLIKDVKATGIEAKLKAAKKGYFALSPRRDADGSIVFWLNPMEQNHNNAGWFKVGQLEQWINNQGPIPKDKSK